MEEPPRYQVYPQVQQQQPQHRPDDHVNTNNLSPDRTRPIQYPAKMYEGSDSGGGYMSGTIEKPPPLIRNREDPLSGPRFYPVNHNNQPQQIQPPQSQSSWNQNIPMQMMGKDMPIQDTMNTNNMIYNANGESYIDDGLIDL